MTFRAARLFLSHMGILTAEGIEVNHDNLNVPNTLNVPSVRTKIFLFVIKTESQIQRAFNTFCN